MKFTREDMGRSNMHHKAEGHTFEFARMLRKESTIAEDLLWQELRGSKLGVKFRRQHPIDKYLVDFFCAKQKLIIEVDGEIHNQPEVKEKDREREVLLNFYGSKFLRFSNEQVLNEMEQVPKTIRENLNLD